MSQPNRNNNSPNDSKTPTKNPPIEENVGQTSVPQNLSKDAFPSTPLSHKSRKNPLEETHSNYLVAHEFIDVQNLLESIQKNYRTKRRDSRIEIRVDSEMKLAWDLIVGGDRNVLEVIVRPMLISILEAAAIYKGLIKAEPVVEDGMKVFRPEVHVTITAPTEEKEESTEDQFKIKFKEFEDFVNKVIFSSDNIHDNAYLVTKGVKKKLFEYIDELLSLEVPKPEVKQLLQEIRQYLDSAPLNEKHFRNGVARIPPIAYKDEILPKLTKIEKLVN